jgi:hypothetical protein
VAIRVQFPGPEDRTVVCGITGSGKTTAAMWHLSGKDFDAQPWLGINFKGDALMNEVAALHGVKTIDLDDMPGEKGLYFVNPLPHDGERLDALLGRIWERGNCGIFVDEVYRIKVIQWFEACMVQGRSKRIPMIICTQRPARMPLFVFSEAQYAQIFNLTKKADRIRIEDDFPGISRDYHLAPYHSYWYNVASREVVEFKPVPNNATIISTFRAKFPPEHALGGEPQEAPTVLKAPRRRVV